MLKGIKLKDLKGTYTKRRDVDVLIEDGLAFIAGDSKHQYIYEAHINEVDNSVSYTIYKDFKLCDGGEIDNLLHPMSKFTINDLLGMDHFCYSKKGNNFIKLLDYEEAIKSIDEFQENEFKRGLAN